MAFIRTEQIEPFQSGSLNRRGADQTGSGSKHRLSHTCQTPNTMNLRTGSFPAQDWLLVIQSPQTSYYEGVGWCAAWPTIPGKACGAF